MQATFKAEDEAEDGEPIGPLILSADDYEEELGSMRLSEAKQLAELNCWIFSEN